MEEYIGSGLLLYLLSRNILRNPKVFAFLHQQKEWKTEIYKKILQSLHHKNKNNYGKRTKEHMANESP